MPELPEVQTIVTDLHNRIAHNKIVDVTVSNKKMRFPAKSELVNNVLNQTISRLRRRAKYILIDLNSGESIIIHLGMSGRLLLQDQISCDNKHNHLNIYLSSGKVLTFYDPRRFGFYGLLSDYQFLLDKSGVEPLSDDLDIKTLHKIISNTSRMIKDVLMDASKIAGIGNIYASEILFLARICPTRPANMISSDECEVLIQSIKHILLKAINYGGSTLRDYRKSDGQIGEFQDYFLVYGKQGEKCIRCSSVIEKIQIKNRSSYYCESCQY